MVKKFEEGKTYRLKGVEGYDASCDLNKTLRNLFLMTDFTIGKDGFFVDDDGYLHHSIPAPTPLCVDDELQFFEEVMVGAVDEEETPTTKFQKGEEVIHGLIRFPVEVVQYLGNGEVLVWYARRGVHHVFKEDTLKKIYTPEEAFTEDAKKLVSDKTVQEVLANAKELHKLLGEYLNDDSAK